MPPNDFHSIDNKKEGVAAGWALSSLSGPSGYGLFLCLAGHTHTHTQTNDKKNSFAHNVNLQKWPRKRIEETSIRKCSKEQLAYREVAVKSWSK